MGIEGVKVELVVPEEISAKSGSIDGTLRFYSMHDQTVQSVKVKLVERYKRGRGKGKLVDEYTLGEISLEQDVEVPAHQYIDIDFSLPFEMLKSGMDELGDKNFMFRGAVKTAKMLKGVKSVYRLEAEAKVKGTALHPFDRKEIAVTR